MRKSLSGAALLAAVGASLVLPAPAAHAATDPFLFVIPPASSWNGWYAEGVDVPVTANGGFDLPTPRLTSLTYTLSGATTGTGSFTVNPEPGQSTAGTISVTKPGLTKITVVARNSQDNVSTEEVTVGVDPAPPRVIFEGRMGTTDPVFEQGEIATFRYACTDDYTGVTTCDGPDQGSRIDTSTLGEHQVDVVTADRAGNAAAMILGYRVVASLRLGGAPSVGGTPKVGHLLTATAPAVTAPGGGQVAPTLAYAWRRDGVAVPGATAATYPLTPADAGRAVSVAVTASAPGYGSGSAVSQPVAVSAADAAISASMRSKGRGKVAITVRVAAPGLDTSGPVTVSRNGKVVGRGTVRNGTVVITLKKQPARTKATYVVTYAGGAGIAPATTRVSGKVR